MPSPSLRTKSHSSAPAPSPCSHPSPLLIKRWAIPGSCCVSPCPFTAWHPPSSCLCYPTGWHFTASCLGLPPRDGSASQSPVCEPGYLDQQHSSAAIHPDLGNSRPDQTLCGEHTISLTSKSCNTKLWRVQKFVFRNPVWVSPGIST